MEKAGLRFVRSYTGDWPEAIPGSEHGEVEYALTAPGPAPHPAPAGPDLAPQG
ncbi:hypothetical protein SAMN05444716_104174 [Streptomyces harbinensis]|uniref:Uncharacterized protein n=2 Tax=Streptomyces harbinensis TaxID=1176198 RepID=A0A1I6SVH1_9ACTN|nr:hypothetical protein SAMN05444716_104174 [Streptomyces harbinensis]